jgi:hypothetical protein
MENEINCVVGILDMGGGNVADLEIFDVSKLICKHNVQKEAQC